MPNRKQAKLPPPGPVDVSSGTLRAVSVALAAVLGLLVTGEALGLRKKPPTIAELRDILISASHAADNHDIMRAHQLAESVLPYNKVVKPPTHPGEFWMNLTKLEQYRVPVKGLDVFHLKNVINEDEAAQLRQVLTIAYDHWKIEDDFCFDHVWVREKATLPKWWWKDRLLAAGILNTADLIQKDTGRYKMTCLKRSAATPEKVSNMRQFLNVSRSVIVHRGLSKISDTIEERISDLTGAPLSHAYYTQLLHYVAGENYNTHTDCTLNQMGVANDERYMTTLLYLSTTEGGETSFPVVNVSFTPTLGDLVLWRNVYEDTGVCNTHSYHAAKPVIKGEKYVFQKWWKFDPADHKAEHFTKPRNNLGCDRNEACREYIYVHRLPKNVVLNEIP